LRGLRGRKSGYAPVEMTNLLRTWRGFSMEKGPCIATNWSTLDGKSDGPAANQGDEKRFRSRNHIRWKVALPFVIPSEAEGSAVPRTSPGNAEFYPQTELSSRPERTRISYHADLATPRYAPFRRERRMRIANANKFDRKSGERSGEICGFFLLSSHTL
jgi:hypothetical protein